MGKWQVVSRLLGGTVFPSYHIVIQLFPCFQAIKMRMHPELIAIVSRASHQVVDRSVVGPSGSVVMGHVYQGWRNQLSVLSESYICCSGQVTFSSWLVRGQVKKKSKPKCLKSKNTFYIRKCRSRHQSWKRKKTSSYRSYSSLSNLQRGWCSLSHYYVVFATKIYRWWIVFLLNPHF